MRARLISWIAVGLLGSVACSQRSPGPAEAVGRSQAAVAAPTCGNGSTLGFESVSGWTASSGTLSLSTNHTQGSFSLAVASPVNYTTIVSGPLSSTDTELAGLSTGTALEVDLLLPTTQPNPFWFGAMQMFVSAPAEGVFNQFLGEDELTGLPLGTFVTESFAVPTFVASALQGRTYSDLTLTIVLNVPFAGTGTYLLDNVRTKGQDGTAGNIHPELVCVNAKAPGVYEALFGYSSENTKKLLLPVGSSNTFGSVPGDGQPDVFFPMTQPAAFAVAFDGNPITWSLAGGCATASAQSPACPSTPCSQACVHGQQCVGGQCVTECGDGLCAGRETCATCPADCGCSAGTVCSGNACGKPSQCGIEWQCGAGVSFGVAVDCGACPNGGTCVNHACK
jgi:hypothetical protein